MSKEVRYNIHNLVLVSISEGVEQKIIEQTEAQLLYFKGREFGDGKPLYSIRIRPFVDFPRNPAETRKMFHSVYGSERSFVDERGRFAFQKMKTGYTIYTDVPFVVNLFIQLLLVRQGFSFVHSAAVAGPDGSITLFTGGGGVGKTALIGGLVGHKGFRLLGDDIVIVGKDGECFSFPRHFVLKDYHRSVYPKIFKKNKVGLLSRVRASIFSFFLKHNSWIEESRDNLMRLGVWRMVSRLAPSLRGYLALVPVEEIFGNDAILDSGNIRKVIFLERSQNKSFESESLSSDAVVRLMFSIIHHEWMAGVRRLLSMGALGIEDIPGYFASCSHIISGAVSGKPCTRISIPENASPDELFDVVYTQAF